MTPVTTAEAATTEPAPATRFGGISVRTRIVVAFAVLVGLALAGAGLVAYALESAHIDEEVARQVDQELAEFREFQQSGFDPVTNRPFAEEVPHVGRLIELFLTRNVPDDDEKLVGYWDGRPQTQLGMAHADLLSNRRFRATVDDHLAGGGSQMIDTEWGEVLVTVQPVRSSRTSGALVIANFLDDEHQELTRIMQTYAIVSLLSLGLVSAVAAWQAGRLLRPVRTLRETADRISETDLSLRIPETGNDDITALTRTANAMLERLESAFTGQRRFLDAAGHELKTPLTVIRGHMELLNGADPAEVEETRTLLLDEIDRMARLVNDLIMLAKADRPDFVRPEPVDLAPFTETVLEKCRGLGDRSWKLDEAAYDVADLDEQRITQAMLELAQNAVKHTRPGDEVAVGSSLDPRHGPRLWVRDTGRGVRDEDKARIFDRFERAAVTAADEGFGLGLSIVRAIAAAHGGTVTVEDAAPSGAMFVITLPKDRKDTGSWPAS